MPAIITDQFRILNAETFSKSMTGIGTTSNYYYTFLGHPNPTDVSIEEYGDLLHGQQTHQNHWILFSKKIDIMILCSF